ncbi:MAG: protein kinase, partial [Haloarculaceae archaeon]
DDLRERRAATETETYQDAYRRHLAHGDRHQEDANADREADDGEAALDAFEEAIDAYQEALAVATEHDVGDAEAVRDRLVDVQTRRDQLEISRYGERVAGVDVPDVEDDPEVDESVFDAAIAELESVLDDVSELDGDRAEEVELVRQEAARKLVRARYERAKYRATRAVAAVHDDDYDEANETFADVATRLDDLASAASDLDVTEYDDDVERLREVCEENADIVRKTSLGLVDDDLIPLDAERSAEGDAERSPSENRAAPTDASRSKPDGARTESSSSSSPSPSPSPSPSQNRRAGTDRSRRGSTDAPDVEDLSYAAVEKHEQIGSGGNADVYRAVATADGTERTVALKEPRMQGTLHADVIDRFVSEAETWSKLDDHPNVVSVVGYGSAPIPWIALEYMDGGDLNAAATTLDVGEKLRIATRVTDAVWHAHQRGIAHLDLKPANILFASDGTESAGTPKVADWGLAKMLLDHSKSVEGLSPRYSAPEQFDSETYGSPDNQTDVYQLGTIVYELLTGTHPFEGRPSEVMHSVLYEEAAPPTSQDPTLPDELDDVLRTAMAKDRTDRYEAAVYLRDRLEDVAP